MNQEQIKEALQSKYPGKNVRGIFPFIANGQFIAGASNDFESKVDPDGKGNTLFFGRLTLSVYAYSSGLVNYINLNDLDGNPVFSHMYYQTTYKTAEAPVILDDQEIFSIDSGINTGGGATFTYYAVGFLVEFF